MKELNIGGAAGTHIDLATVALACALIVAAVCINFSWIHQFHDADSLLMPLISIDKPTPFYWGDNRYGMLVPWIVSAIRDYTWNLLVQTQLLTFAALGCVVLFHCTFWPAESGFNSRNLGNAVLTILLAAVVFQPSFQVFRVFFLAHPYFLALTLGLAATSILLDGNGPLAIRYALSAVLLLLCFWVMWALAPVILAFVTLLPAKASRHDAKQHLVQRLPAILLVVVCFAVIYAISLQYPRIIRAGLAPLDRWPVSAYNIWLQLEYSLVYVFRFGALIAAAAVLAFVRWREDPSRAFSLWSRTAAVLLIAVGFAMATAGTEWVIYNNYEWRYWLIPVVLIFLVCSAPVIDRAAGMLAKWMGSPSAAGLLGAAVLTVFAIKAFGLPSLSMPTAKLDEVSGKYYAQLQQLGCTHAIGNYWMSWSAVYYNRRHSANLKLWAIALRATDLKDQWSKTPPEQRTYCGLCADWEIEEFRKVYGLPPLRQTGSAGEMCRFRH